MTQCSLNEVQMVLTKAARGCGAGAGRAARFGLGAVNHLCMGGDIAPITKAFADLPEGPIVEYTAFIQQGLSEAIDDKAYFPKGNGLWEGYVHALPYQIERCSEAGFVVHLGKVEKRPTPARLEIDPQDLENWKKLAAKTFVPETDQSRLSGAGAGLTDND